MTSLAQKRGGNSGARRDYVGDHRSITSSAMEQAKWNSEAKALRGLEVGDQLEVAPASPRVEVVHKEKPPRVAAAASRVGAVSLGVGFGVVRLMVSALVEPPL